MSMNLYVRATVKVVRHFNDGSTEESIERSTFNTWQTPTEATYKILGSGNPEKAYREYIREQFPEDMEETFWIREFPDYPVEPYTKEEIEQFFPNMDLDEFVNITLEKTERVVHEEELTQWLSLHKKWDIEWYAL